MIVSRKIVIALFAGIVGLCTLEFAERHSMREAPSLISTAEARIGRPLTPVSVAGVARRTVRRCAVGVYDC